MARLRIYTPTCTYAMLFQVHDTRFGPPAIWPILYQYRNMSESKICRHAKTLSGGVERGPKNLPLPKFFQLGFIGFPVSQKLVVSPAADDNEAALCGHLRLDP